MDGILSGFRFASKKASKSADDKRADTNASELSEPPSTDATAVSGNVAQTKPDSTTQDRSPTMRLTKSTTGKPGEDDFEIPSDPVMPSYGTGIVNKPTTPATSHSTSPSAVIGPKITFKGELTGEEDLLIQGRVEGTIDLKSNRLTVGPQGVVKANLMAKTIIIEGTVEGDLIGQERIEIKSSSNVKGNLIAARVTLEDGAKFRGSIDMESHNGGSGKYTAPIKSSGTEPG